MPLQVPFPQQRRLSSDRIIMVFSGLLSSILATASRWSTPSDAMWNLSMLIRWALNSKTKTVFTQELVAAKINIAAIVWYMSLSVTQSDGPWRNSILAFVASVA